MPTFIKSYEDIRREAKELLKELKKTNPKAKLTQAQTLIANKYDCKNFALLRAKTEQNHGVIEVELTSKVIEESIDILKHIFKIEPFEDNGISCATINLIGRTDITGKSVKVHYTNLDEILNNKNNILSLHKHFSSAIGEDYLNFVCDALSNKYLLIDGQGDGVMLEKIEEFVNKSGRSEERYLLEFPKTSTKDLENISDEDAEILKSNMGTNFMLHIDESMPINEDMIYTMHSASSKTCFYDICLNKRDNKKEQIANELFNNSTNKYIQELLSEYLNSRKGIEGMPEKFDNKLVLLDYCIEYIKSVNFDVKGWGLWEIPIWFTYVFKNTKENKMFDIAVSNKTDAVPRFIDEDTKTIEEAIEKFRLHDIKMSNRN
jgi:hypothetical protein